MLALLFLSSQLFIQSRTVADVGLPNDVLSFPVDVLDLVFAQVLQINGIAVFDDHGHCFDPGEVGFKHVLGIDQSYGNNGTAGLCGDLKASALEFLERLIRLVSCSLRADQDGNAVLYVINGFQDGLHAFPNVLSVEEQGVDEVDPDVQKRYLPELFFVLSCNPYATKRPADGLNKGLSLCSSPTVSIKIGNRLK